jgi:hypothetical protein
MPVVNAVASPTRLALINEAISEREMGCLNRMRMNFYKGIKAIASAFEVASIA